MRSLKSLVLIYVLSIIVLLFSSKIFAAQTIKADGSSTVFPITEAMSEEFQNSQKGKTRVTVGISGTGGGFKKFCRGETDVQNASRPISDSEVAECKKSSIQFIEIPVAYDAMVIAVHKAQTLLNEISIEELKTIWEPKAQGKVLLWSHVRPQWPAVPLKLYGAGADSGTFDYFTEAVVGKAKSSRGDYTASEDDNTLVTGIASDKGSLGYLPLAYYEMNKSKLKALAVFSKSEKTGILPSQETVKNGSYLLSRPIFLYVSSKSWDRLEVKEFIRFYLQQAPAIVPSVKYVPLPKKAYDSLLKKIEKGQPWGSLFQGQAQVKMKIEDLLKKEAK